MLMQESIKEVINIHKCKFFFKKILCGLAGRPAQAADLYGPSTRGPAGSLSWPAPCFFCGPAGQALIAIPNFYDVYASSFVRCLKRLFSWNQIYLIFTYLGVQIFVRALKGQSF